MAANVAAVASMRTIHDATPRAGRRRRAVARAANEFDPRKLHLAAVRLPLIGTAASGVSGIRTRFIFPTCEPRVDGTGILAPTAWFEKMSAVLCEGRLSGLLSLRERAAEAAEGGPVGIISAGERGPDGSLRVALEDWLGAGAIIDRLPAPLAPEARLARDAYRSLSVSPKDMIFQSVSGRELVDRGFGDDVALAAEENVSGTAPRLIGDAFQAG